MASATVESIPSDVPEPVAAISKTTYYIIHASPAKSSLPRSRYNLGRSRCPSSAGHAVRVNCDGESGVLRSHKSRGFMKPITRHCL